MRGANIRLHWVAFGSGRHYFSTNLDKLKNAMSNQHRAKSEPNLDSRRLILGSSLVQILCYVGYSMIAVAVVVHGLSIFVLK